MRAHIDTYGNEVADHLAKVGATEPLTTHELPYSACFLKAKIRDIINTDWEQKWDDYEHGRQTKQFYSKPDTTKARHILKHSRRVVSQVVNIISGHNNLNYHRSLINSDIDPNCRLCHIAPETFYHWLTECPRLRTCRQDVFLDTEPVQDMTWSVQGLLDFARKPCIQNMLEDGWV